MSASIVFDFAFPKITKQLEFDRGWSNGTGYFDHAVYGGVAPNLHPGEIVRSLTPGDRRLILIGTRLGNVAVFDRFSNQEGKDEAVFVTNTTRSFSEGGWLAGGRVSESEMILLLGDYGDVSANIGWRIEQIFDSLRRNSKTELAE